MAASGWPQVKDPRPVCSCIGRGFNKGENMSNPKTIEERLDAIEAKLERLCYEARIIASAFDDGMVDQLATRIYVALEDEEPK